MFVPRDMATETSGTEEQRTESTEKKDRKRTQSLSIGDYTQERQKRK